MYKFLVSAAVLMFAFSANAQDSAAVQEYADLFGDPNDSIKKRGEVLQEVIITPQQKEPVSAVRSGIAPMDLPQSLQVIEGEVIQQQQSQRLSEVIKNVNGVYVSSARGGMQESFFSRGYDMSANNIFKNGFRFSSGSMPEVSSLEKVEVLKGSAALLYGNVAPGGILNMITKTPKFTHGGEISMQAGSYSFYKPSVDIYGPLNKYIAYRVNASYENSESFRDVVKNERFYINPSFLFKVSPKTEIVLQGDYLNYDFTPDFGTGVIGKEILDLPRDLYLGASWSNGHTTQASVSALLNHEINNNWKFNFNSSFQNYGRKTKGTERVQPLADGTWNRPIGQTKSEEQVIGEQISLQGIFNTGKIKHQLFTGIDLENAQTNAYTYTFENPIYGTGNIFDFENFEEEGPIPNGLNSRIVRNETNRFGVYAQDLISVTEKFKVLAGIRWSWQESQADTHNRVDDGDDNPDNDEFELSEAPKLIDAAFSPKVGLIFQPNKQMSLFASYANSFTPNSGTTVEGDPLEPSIIDQFEIGIKKDYLNGLISTNLTLYQIVNSNLAQTAEFNADGLPNTNNQIKVLSGETTSKGIEVDITAKPVAGLNIIAGYSYNDMRYTETSGTDASFIEGDRLVRTPQHTANLSFFYTVQSGKLKGLSVGALGNYIGDRFGGWNDQININSSGVVTILDRDIPIDGYTTIDVSAGYEWKRFSLLARLSNITNELNYTVHENYSVNPIAPRQILVGLKYKF